MSDLRDRTEVLERVDLEALWVDLVGPRARSGWPCPSPSHAQTGATPPVNLSPAATPPMWHCKGCGEGGTAVDLLVMVRGLSVADAFVELHRLAGMPSETQPPRRRDDVVPARRESNAAPPPEAAARALSRFVEARCWSMEVAEEWQLTAVLDRWGRWRVRFPFHVDGRVAFYQDRIVSGFGAKFLSPTGAKAIPFARDLAVALAEAHRLGCAVLVEGPADLIALAHDLEVPAVFALPGTSTPTSRWAPPLAGLRVAVIADNDTAGEALRRTAEHALGEVGATVTQVRIPGEINDVDDWRRTFDGDDHAFGEAVYEAFDVAEEALR